MFTPMQKIYQNSSVIILETEITDFYLMHMNVTFFVNECQCESQRKTNQHCILQHLSHRFSHIDKYFL